jgi:hypothetical protein
VDSNELIWNETVRLLARQEADLDTLQSKALGVLSSGGVIAGLFSVRLVTGSASTARHVVVVMALSAFAVSAFVCVNIVRPRTWSFSHRIDDLTERMVKGQAMSLKSVTANLSRDLDLFREKNAPQLKKMQVWLTWACALLAVQVVFWGVAALA